MRVKLDLGGYRHIAVEPVAGALGAEISGVNAAAALDPAVAEELARALAQFHVLFLRDQQLDEAGVLRFARCFGTPGTAPLAGRSGDQPLVGHLSREADAPAAMRNFGDRWHMDRAGDRCPPKGFMLYCEEAPAYGGDTLFASLSAAYDALSPEARAFCAGLTGVHSMSGVFGLDERTDRPEPMLGGDRREAPFNDPAQLAYIRQEAEHPLVCRHPDTGRPYLFVTGNYFLRIKELPRADSDRLIDELNRHVVRPDFTCRFRWRRGSVAVLDNRCTLHYAANDYTGFARRMLRVELAGDWRPQRALPEQRRETA
jgi:taurine dioxygenase